MKESTRTPMNSSGWLRLSELPWSYAMTYALIRLGKLETARLTVKGTENQRGIRLVSQRSIDAFLSELALEQLQDSVAEAERARKFAVGKGSKKRKSLHSKKPVFYLVVLAKFTLFVPCFHGPLDFKGTIDLHASASLRCEPGDPPG